MLWRTTRYTPYECVATPAQLARQRSTTHPRSLILGLDYILYADLEPSKVSESHARRLFLKDRRPELYGSWLLR